MSTLAAAAPRRFGDRLNPILVKEVRQALRGRYFRLMFWLTLAIATLAGLLVVAYGVSEGEADSIGGLYFMVVFGCMAAAVHVFTPFSAFLSTSAEWDENTHDLLVLSNLRPRQIVLGKLLSTSIQALLYYSTFGPCLVLAFLLNGVDLLSIVVLLACSFVTCIALSLAGIALASLAQRKALRGMLMAAFGAGLALVWGGGNAAASGLVSMPQSLRDEEVQVGLAFYVSAVLLVGGLFGALATVRFSHEEENRSSGLRILGTSFILVAGAWGAALHAQFHDHDTTWVTQVVAACLLLLLWLFFMSEPDTLGRRVEKHVPAAGWRAVLSIPFLPGGGRGVLLFLLHCALALLAVRIALLFDPATASQIGESLAEVAVFYGYAFVYLALPGGIASFFVRSARGRMLVRVTTLVFVPLGLFGPALLGLIFGWKDWMEMEHPFNPVWLMMEVAGNWRSKFEVGMTLTALAVFALLTLLVNARRMAAGVREVLAASQARRARGA